MSAARTLFIIISLLTLFAVTAFIGCEPDRTGTAAANSAPQVYIVNTPPDSAQFSRNPDLNWYGTDIDGYITFFRYAVVVDSMLLIGGNHVPPEEFVRLATDDQYGWTTLEVDLDHPQATATIRLYANVDFPVDSFVTQYFFVQACDDREAMSEIKWRMYSRNNHFPNTHFPQAGVVREFFINAPDPSSPAPGITVDWEGADSTDWGRAEPPLEYEWRLYGPFDNDATIYVNMVKENCIYDPTVDSFVNCIDVPIVDLDNLPSAVENLPQPLVRSTGPNYANDSTDVWVTETQTTIYNVYEQLDLTKTTEYKFFFWVRARDDGFVPDPTPSFGQFKVYEAKFENSVMVIDETGYDIRNGRWAPRDLDSAKAFFYNTLTDMGYDDFDTIWDSSFTQQMHYFYTAVKKNTLEWPLDTLPKPDSVSLPRLLDVLAHKVIIFYNDDSQGGPNESEFGTVRHVFDGLDMGGSAWMFARNLGDAATTTLRGTEFGKTIEFMSTFGISMVVSEGWLNGIFYTRPPIYNEEFIGGFSNIPGFPHLMVDHGEGSLLDTRYPRFFTAPDHIWEGLPEVGVGTRTPFAAPLYLYLSKNGDLSFFHGKVNAVIQQVGDMRTACFMFTPLCIETEPMREVFDIIMPWLSEKFDVSPKVTLNVPSYKPAFSDVSERRARLDRFLKYVSEYATPEERTIYGMQKLKPFVVKPMDEVTE